MIRSMTAFGSARAESHEGTITVEFRTVNSRFLDVNFRLPEDLRMVEGALREQLGKTVTRGKVDVRVNYARNKTENIKTLDPSYLAAVAEQLNAARGIIPDVAAPHWADLVKNAPGADDDGFDAETWIAMSLEAGAEALGALQANREREGQRLATMMLQLADDMDGIVGEVAGQLPQILSEHQQKLSTKLRETLDAACPGGFAQITGEELSARIAHETSLFSLRADVAEELSRLKSHIAELRHLLSAPSGAGTHRDSSAVAGAAGKHQKGTTGSVGKRLDFLFQEMNREANTLGSKANGLSVTRAAIDLKLVIEQLREQAQNIE